MTGPEWEQVPEGTLILVGRRAGQTGHSAYAYQRGSDKAATQMTQFQALGSATASHGSSVAVTQRAKVVREELEALRSSFIQNEKTAATLDGWTEVNNLGLLSLLDQQKARAKELTERASALGLGRGLLHDAKRARRNDRVEELGSDDE